MSFERKAFYSPTQVALITGQHPATILRYIHDGRLRAVRLSERAYRIPLAGLLTWLEDAEVRPIRRRRETGASAAARRAAEAHVRVPLEA